MARAEAGGTLEEARAGKRMGLLDLPIRRVRKKAERYHVKPSDRPRRLKAISLPRKDGGGSGAGNWHATRPRVSASRHFAQWKDSARPLPGLMARIKELKKHAK